MTSSHPYQPLEPLALRDLGFALGTVDRRAEWRGDAAHIAEEAARTDRETILMAGDRAVADTTRQPLGLRFNVSELEAAGAMTDEQLYLGRVNDLPVFAARSRLTDSQDVLNLVDLRSLASGGDAAPEDLGLIAASRALFAWHDRHGFCANCGHKTDMSNAGWRRDCSGCGAHHFPRTDPVVIMLVTDGERCLMGRSPHFKEGMYSCLAGFVEPGETIEDAVRREALEEAGITAGQVTYALSQPWPFPMSLMIGCHARAETTDISLFDNELEDARWFDLPELISICNGSHPSLFVPPRMAIAHHLIRGFIDRVTA